MPRAVLPPIALAPVTTMLTPAERLRVDAAGEGLYHTLHRDSLDDVLRDLRERRAAAVLVSVARYAAPFAVPIAVPIGEPEAARVAAVVREFPRVPAVALLSQPEGSGTQGAAGQAAIARAVLTLGRCGVERLVTVWAKLLSRRSAPPSAESDAAEQPRRRRVSTYRIREADPRALYGCDIDHNPEPPNTSFALRARPGELLPELGVPSASNRCNGSGGVVDDRLPVVERANPLQEGEATRWAGVHDDVPPLRSR